MFVCCLEINKYNKFSFLIFFELVLHAQIFGMEDSRRGWPQYHDAWRTTYDTKATVYHERANGNWNEGWNHKSHRRSHCAFGVRRRHFVYDDVRSNFVLKCSTQNFSAHIYS